MGRHGGGAFSVDPSKVDRSAAYASVGKQTCGCCWTCTRCEIQLAYVIGVEPVSVRVKHSGPQHWLSLKLHIESAMHLILGPVQFLGI